MRRHGLSGLTFADLAGFRPNPMQEAMAEVVASDDCAVLLQSPTGSGKTEAVVVPGLQADLRLFLIYPARSLVDDQTQRLAGMFLRLSSQPGQRFSLVVDTGGESLRRVFAGGRETTLEADNPRRHLYDGDVIVTTLDKFLVRFFGFGEEQKAYIFPFRLHYGLKESLFCFDEAHTYDDTAFTNFARLVRALYVAGQRLVVMTATMPPDYAEELNFLKTLDFVSERRAELEAFAPPPSPAKRLTYQAVTEEKSVVDTLAELAGTRYAPEKRLILTVETVADAIRLFQALQARGWPRLLLYHGRLPDHQRTERYAQLKAWEGEEGGYVLVTTSAIEVGCDLDAHVLLTEFCLPENLLQRAGRCNRKGRLPDAEVVVIGQSLKPWLRPLTDEALATYREVLQQQSGGPLDAAALAGCIQRQPVFDYRAEILFDMLYEYVYEARLENKPLHDRGLIVTRSWESSVTLTTGVVRDQERGDFCRNAISVPLSRCATWDEAKVEPCRVFVRHFDRTWGEYKPVLEELSPYHGGFAYFRDMVVEVPSDAYNPDLGYVRIPKPFQRIRNDGYTARLKATAVTGETVWLRYLDCRPNYDPAADGDVT